MKILKGWKELACIVLLAALCALIVRHFFLAPFQVPSGSMQPALKPGDFIFVSQVAYGFQIPGSGKWATLKPRRGDIVTFYYNSKKETPYVKRVIGVAGDSIEIKNNRLVINGNSATYTLLDNKADNPNSDLFDLYEEKVGNLTWRVIFQKNKIEKSNPNFRSLVVPPGEVFLLGDNRDVSDDSRYWGTVPSDQIFGRASLIWLSLDRQQPWAGNRFPSMRWERILARVY